MTIADKLKTIAENEERVYKAGQAEGAKSWNDFILSSFGNGWGQRLFGGQYVTVGSNYSVDELPPIDTSGITNFSGIFEGCDQITKAPALDTANGTNFESMFNGCSNLTEAPDLDTSKGKQFNYMFQYCSRLKEFPNCDFSNATSLDYVFTYCPFKTVPVLNTSKVTSFYHTFEDCSIETVEGIDFSGCKYDLYPFEYCGSLKNLTVNGVIAQSIYWMYNYNLTRESLLSVINALKDYSTVGTTYTASFPTSAVDRLTEEDIAIATAKGWTITTTD